MKINRKKNGKNSTPRNFAFIEVKFIAAAEGHLSLFSSFSLLLATYTVITRDELRKGDRCLESTILKEYKSFNKLIC